MLDTNLTKVIENTIIEFNEWALKKPFTQKYALEDIKGVFTEKFKRNVKVTSYVIGDIFKPTLLSRLSVENGVITDINFDLPLRSSHTTANNNFVKDCNDALKNISLRSIAKDTPLQFETAIDLTIQSINQFKIKN